MASTSARVRYFTNHLVNPEASFPGGVSSHDRKLSRHGGWMACNNLLATGTVPTSGLLNEIMEQTFPPGLLGGSFFF